MLASLFDVGKGDLFGAVIYFGSQVFSDVYIIQLSKKNGILFCVGGLILNAAVEFFRVNGMKVSPTNNPKTWCRS